MHRIALVWLRADGGKGLPVNLLSNHIRIVACLDFEATVVGPEIDGDADASDTTFVDLHPFQHTASWNGFCLRYIVPSPLLPSQKWKIRGRHIFSNTQRRAGSV